MTPRRKEKRAFILLKALFILKVTLFCFCQALHCLVRNTWFIPGRFFKNPFIINNVPDRCPFTSVIENRPSIGFFVFCIFVNSVSTFHYGAGILRCQTASIRHRKLKCQRLALCNPIRYNEGRVQETLNPEP